MSEVVRIYTREKGGQVADNTLDPGIDAELVVEVEASRTPYNDGAQYKTGLTIKDLDAGTDVAFEPAPPAGAIGTAPWTDQRDSFTYTIAAAELAQHAGHVCQAHAYLLVGVKEREVSFAEGPMFLIVP